MAVALVMVGGGQMGGALVSGLLASGRMAPESVMVVEPSAERREVLAGAHPGLVVVDVFDPKTVAGAEGVVLAVKPDVAEAVLRPIGASGARRILSIVAGLQTARLEAVLPPDLPVVRAMPNTPALIGAGVSVISGGMRAESADLEWAEDVLSAVGRVLRLPERHLDAVTAVSGSGPAYVFLVAEAMIEAGVLSGLPRDVSRTLVVDTLAGSARMLEETGEDPGRLRASVTSPGGTTAAGLRALEARAVRSAFLEAVASAAERSRQLGR
jgi:pyrroline-5-carboxylate reductase